MMIDGVFLTITEYTDIIYVDIIYAFKGGVQSERYLSLLFFNIPLAGCL